MSKQDFNEKIISDAVSILKDDGVIIVPTDTVYGLACSGNSQVGVNKIYSIKKRNFNKKLPVIVDNYDRLMNMCEVNKDSLRKLKKFFPGELTIILKKKNSEETVAVRMINNEIINKIIERIDCFLYLTSANVSNDEPISDISGLMNEFDGKVDMIVMGNKMSKVSSTIVDLTGNELKLVREGNIKFSKILEVYNRG